MPIGKANYNFNLPSGSNEVVVPENASRTQIFIKNVSASDLHINFGAPAGVGDALTLASGESIFLTNRDVYDIRNVISMLNASGGNVQVQAEEMSSMM